MFGIVRRKVKKVYYQLDGYQDYSLSVGILDIKTGIYWVSRKIRILENRSKKTWVEYASGAIESNGIPVDDSVRTWLGLQATHLKHFDRIFNTDDEGPR